MKSRPIHREATFAMHPPVRTATSRSANLKSMEQKLIDYLRKQHGLIVAELTAERTIGVVPAVRYCSGTANGFKVAREFPWRPGVWQTVRIRVTTADTAAGMILVSVDGDEFQGVKDLPVFRPAATDYRPKWGLYRGITRQLPHGESWVEHKDASARKL